MKLRIAHLAFVLGLAGAVSVGCGSDDDSSTPPTGGTGGGAGKGGAGKGGSGHGGSSAQGGTAEGGSAGTGEAGAEPGGAAGAGGEQGEYAGSGPGGEGGALGVVRVYSATQIERGKVIVRSEALCGNCHTQRGGVELGGNPTFRNGALPAPNLTDDVTGIGEWTDEQVINAFRNGIDDDGRHLDAAMPYWFFHNMSDADAQAVVAFLRSLPHVSLSTGERNPNSVAVAPLSPSSFPETTLAPSSANYAEAQMGKYLVSGVVPCVRCHSSASGGLPIPDFFSGVPPADGTVIFPPNLTPDDTGLATWTAADVAKAIKQGVDTAGRTLCGSMPSGSKGYGGMSDADAHAIGVYLTTIPKVSKPSASPALQPMCPSP